MWPEPRELWETKIPEKAKQQCLVLAHWPDKGVQNSALLLAT